MQVCGEEVFQACGVHATRRYGERGRIGHRNVDRETKGEEIGDITTEETNGRFCWICGAEKRK